MSIWKSPIFYFGIALTLMVIAALGAPYVVNWNGYKAQLEDFGERLTGRVVTIDGPISVRLFPWPRVEMDDVQIANQDAAKKGAFFSADRVAVRVSLAGLLSGSLNVEEIELLRPTVHLLRDAGGQGNWVFRQNENIQPSALLKHVKLDTITVSDGRVVVEDQTKGFSAHIDEVSGDMSAPELTGPWRAKGAAHYAGLPFSFTFGSGEYGGEELKFGFKVLPIDPTLPTLSFDGQVDSAKADGKIQISSVVQAEGKGNQEGRLRPLDLQADVEAPFASVALKTIKLQPVDTGDASMLIEGQALIDLANGVKIDADLNAPRLNVDAVLGAQSLEAWRAGGIAGFLDGLTKSFPKSLSIDLNFNATVLTYAQQTLENVALSVDATRDAIRVKRLSSGLPGQSRIAFDGIVFPGESGAELGGTVAIESLDVRALAGWAFPASVRSIERYWTGNRGRLKAQSRLTLTNRRLGLQELDYELDGYQGGADISYGLNSQANKIDVKLTVSTLDLDSYIKGGVALFPTDGVVSWGEIATGLAGDSVSEKHVQIEAKYALLNGIRAQGIAIDFASGVGGLDIRKFDIGSVAGAALTAKGQILQNDGEPLGDIAMHVSAADPTGLVQFLGMSESGKATPQWVQSLGATELDLKFLVGPDRNEPVIKFLADGTSGVFTIRGTSEVRNLSLRRDADLQFDLAVGAKDGSKLLRLLGVPAVVDETGEGQFTLHGQGSAEAGVQIKSTLAAAASITDVKGALTFPDQQAYRFTGRSILTVPDPKTFFRALGAPVQETASQQVALTSTLNASPDGIDFGEITGDWGGQTVVGTVRILPGKRVSANIDIDRAVFSDLLSIMLVNWRGVAPTLDEPFAQALPLGIVGEFWIRPKTLTLWGGQSANEAVIGVLVEPDSRRISLAGRMGDGEALAIELGVKPKSGQFEIDISGKAPLDLQLLYSGKDGATQLSGKAVIDGQAKGTGLTTYAVLADLTGQGTAQFSGLTFSKIAPQRFAEALPNVVTAEDLSRAIGLLENGGGFQFADSKNVFKLVSGAVVVDPLVQDLGGPKLSLALSSDVPAQTVQAQAQITFDASRALPPASVVLGGAIGDVVARSLTSEIASKLGYEFLARDLAELERVQKEQQEIIAREEKQRDEDEAKFQAYQDQKAELRLRVRELKVHAVQRARDLAKRKLEIDTLLATEPKATAAELERRRREIETYKRLKTAAQGGVPALPDGFNLEPLQPAPL